MRGRPLGALESQQTIRSNAQPIALWPHWPHCVGCVLFLPSMFNMQFILEMVLARAGPMPGASLILIPCSKLLVFLVLDSVWPPGIDARWCRLSGEICA